MEYIIESMPEGYQLQVYEDCGVLERQPHIHGDGTHMYSMGHVNADEKFRTVTWGYTEINALFDDLDPALTYVLRVTYSNEAANKRVQSLWAGPVQLHGPRPLPAGTVEQMLFRLPTSITQDGKLSLQFRLEGPVNVVVSAVELWSSAPSPAVLYIGSVSGLYSDLQGRILGLAYDGIGGITVQLFHAEAQTLLGTTQTDSDGDFSFERDTFEHLGTKDDLQIIASYEGSKANRKVPLQDLFFDPIRYQPIPTEVKGLENNQISLDGIWKIHPTPEDLDSSEWGDFHVPGQWLQQGYDIPQDQTVAVATEFTIPEEWAKHRVFIRFDAIHAGTQYWLNGKLLGDSENLFTPVEWEITDAARFGETNRLDLEMVVDTVSEKLSHSSGYAFHNLGGIDRSVRLYALPQVHVKDMRILTDLDGEYRDANMNLTLTLDNPLEQAQSDLTLHLTLEGPYGELVEHSTQEMELVPLEPGSKTVELASHIPNPLKWNAERPHLYRTILEVKHNGDLLEKLEWNTGFRKIEIKDSQLYLNGKRIKLAGACRHEIDPLTGRADTMHHAERDLELLKGANLNYVRTAHYPPTQELLDAADRLGVYVEAEAPFCWMGGAEDMSHLKAVLYPTSAMIDYAHSHPSVIIWSLANESAFSTFFEQSNELCKELDPTRPTTFNNPDPDKVCDIANLHYPPMPYDNHLKGDPRPLLLGEYFFPICHEQTDVRINPGLRELWGHGHSDPTSDWGKFCAASFTNTFTQPGASPGAWSHIYHSDRLIGGAIWAWIDEPFYFSDGKKAGYAWVHGFWGLIDAWRRPKPEWWLSKLIFSPVWFPTRQVEFTPGQDSVRIPVENRYSFTNLNELQIAWELAGQKGMIEADLPPFSHGEIEIPIPQGTQEGDSVALRVTDVRGQFINALEIELGQRKPKPLPMPESGFPRWSDDGEKIVIEGRGFALVFDRSRANFDTSDPRHESPIISYPALHLTRFDFADLAPSNPPYEELPDPETRFVEDVIVEERADGLEITVQDRYDGFAGFVRWFMDQDGMGRVSYEYTYSGADLNARETGLKLLLEPEYDEVQWRRWSEWDIFPSDHISRTEGSAKAKRDQSLGHSAEGTRPDWPWYLDQNELGTNDFRGVKFNIYEASLVSSDGTGVRVHANADVHFRPCLAERGVRMHILSNCRLGPVVLRSGDLVAGEYVVEIMR